MATSSTCSEASWSTLPEDIVERVATVVRDTFGTEALQPLRSVCKHWSVNVARVITHLRLNNQEREDLDDALSAMHKIFPNVQRLDIPVVWMDDACCRSLAAALPKLTSLELFWGDSITDAGLESLTVLPLKSLKIYHSRLITDGGIASLSGTELEELWLYGANQVSDDGFSLLQNLHNLKVLRLMYCNRLSRRGLGPLIGKGGLEIAVRFCRRISSEISIT